MSATASAFTSMEQAAAIGDRLRLIKGLIDFLRSLGLDKGELLAIVKDAIGLFTDFSIDKLLAFIERLLGAIGQPGTSAVGAVDAAAIDWQKILQFILMLIEMLTKSPA